MRRMNGLKRVLAGAVALLAGAVQAGVDDLTVMALGPLDGRAVVKTADGKMLVLKTGDAVPDSRAIVKQILTNRLVVEETIAGSPPRQQTVWIHKASGGKSRVQRLDGQGPGRQVVPLKVMQGYPPEPDTNKAK